MTPLTVILPLGGYDDFLREAVQSTMDDLNDSDFLFIVSTGIILQKVNMEIFPTGVPKSVFLVESEKKDIVSNLNVGLKNCTTELVARMDGDDVVLKGRFAKQRLFLEENKNILAVGGQMIFICEHGVELQSSNYPRRVSKFPIKPLYPEIAHPAAMIRSSVLEKLGGYSNLFPHVEDHDLWTRMLDFGDIANLNEPVLKYRLHRGQTSRIHGPTTQTNAILCVLHDSTPKKNVDARQRILSYRGEPLINLLLASSDLIGKVRLSKRPIWALIFAVLKWQNTPPPVEIEANSRHSKSNLFADRWRLKSVALMLLGTIDKLKSRRPKVRRIGDCAICQLP